MESPKFSMNAFLVVVIIFSAFLFFVTVKVMDIADRTPVNSFTPIEGTELAVRYSSLEPNGICKGSQNVNTLLLEGNFGTDWGAAAVGDQLYLNAYRTTDLGLLLSDVVRVDTNTFQQTVLLRNAVLRGRCASGELVCLGGVLLSANHPEDNALCRLYSLTDSALSPEGAAVFYLDPDSGQLLYETRDDAAGEDFDARFLARTLAEVRG